MKVKVVRTLFWGGRHEPGKILDMLPDIVKAFGSKYVEPIKETKVRQKRSENEPKEPKKEAKG